MASPLDPIVVYGSELAGHMATASLVNGLGSARPIIQICAPHTGSTDVFYGGSTAPAAYNFLLGLGLDEPTLFLKSSTSFSFGTWFRRWLDSRSWMQAHHSPLPTPAGTPIRHFLARLGLPLEPLLVSAQAALAGRFAHPPEDPNSILSRAEHGYQFSPREWAGLLNTILETSPVERLDDNVTEFDVANGRIGSITLQSGRVLKPWLVVDASGATRAAINAVGGEYKSSRSVSAQAQVQPAQQMGPACRVMDATPGGWIATTHLQGGAYTLAVMASDGSEPQTGFELALGELAEAWVGNCVAVGQAASTIEPLTPAPMMALQRDLERLLELLPSPAGMDVERAEYNRRYSEDVAHLNLFQSTILRGSQTPDGAYWRAVAGEPVDPRLEHKLAQFEHRGTLVSYDLEPFNEEDWTILHFGQGRVPRHHDRLADQLSETEARQTLGQIKSMIDQLVPRMPPHHVYVTKLKQYLEKQTHG